MNPTNIKSDVCIKDLPDGFWKEFPEIYGIDSALGIAKKIGGTICLQLKFILRKSRNRKIREGTVDTHLPKK